MVLTMKWSTQSNHDDLKINKKSLRKKVRLTVYEMALFAMFGALMFGSKKIMEFLPNIHLLGMFTVLLTVVYRKKALIPIYIYVLLDGLISGFNVWWVPYLYVWTLLWGAVMLLPRNLPRKWAVVIYPIICSLHGFLFGILYSPAQALFFGLDFRQTVAWIISGIPFDVIHGISNLIAGLLVYPLSVLLKKLSVSVLHKSG